jgi:hypothetical protein
MTSPAMKAYNRRTRVLIATVIGVPVVLLGLAVLMVRSSHPSQPPGPALPPLPVHVTVRMGGAALVAQVHNESDRYLGVRVLCESAVLPPAAFVLQIRPNGMEEIDWWSRTFVSGDRLTVTHPEYQPLTVTIP